MHDSHSRQPVECRHLAPRDARPLAEREASTTRENSPQIRSLNLRHLAGKLKCSPPVFVLAAKTRARGGIGRRARLRALCPQGRAGSTPVGPSLWKKPFGHPKGFFVLWPPDLP